MNLQTEIKDMWSQIIIWRRELHQRPELGMKLPKTISYISAELTKMGIEHTILSDISCITATIGQGTKCLLLRGDIDAVPVEERSGEDFAATGSCSHACGHDIHATTMLGAACLLKKHEAELNGTVKLLFQSAEETFQGAAAAIEAGIMENPHVDAAFAMHAFAEYDVGQILYGEIPMGACYGFRMTITGKGAHGSQPEKGIDPINAAVQVYLALQSLMAREISPFENATLTIGQFQAGQAANVIPAQAILTGTLRTMGTDVREHLISRINEISRSVAESYRCQLDLEVLSDVPSVINDAAFSEQCLESLKKTGLMTDYRDDLKLIGSEDFANYTKYVPSCYFVSGAGVTDLSKRRGQHNPEIIFNEDVLAVNIAAYVQVALDFQ